MIKTHFSLHLVVEQYCSHPPGGSSKYLLSCVAPQVEPASSKCWKLMVLTGSAAPPTGNTHWQYFFQTFIYLQMSPISLPAKCKWKRWLNIWGKLSNFCFRETYTGRKTDSQNLLCITTVHSTSIFLILRINNKTTQLTNEFIGKASVRVAKAVYGVSARECERGIYIWTSHMTACAKSNVVKTQKKQNCL